MERHYDFDNLTREFISAEGGYIQLSKALVKCLGMTEAVVLSFYAAKDRYVNPRNVGWFYYKHSEQIFDFNLSEFTIRKTKTFLIENGYLVTKMDGMPAKEFYKINYPKIQFCIGNYIKNYKTYSETIVGQDLSKSEGQALSKSEGIDLTKSEGHNKNIKTEEYKEEKKEKKKNIKKKILKKPETNKASIKNEVTTVPLFKEDETVGAPIKKTKVIKPILDYTSYFPESIRHDEGFVKVLMDFVADRIERKNPLTSGAMVRIGNKFYNNTYSMDVIIESFDYAIIKGWDQPFPEGVIGQRKKDKVYKEKFQNNNSDSSNSYHEETERPPAPEGHYYDRFGELQEYHYDDVTVEDTDGYDDYDD